MSRERVHAESTVPDHGTERASANVIVTWDSSTPSADVEEAIKASARKAITLYREGVRS